MAKATDSFKLILTELATNNNKAYYGYYYDDGTSASEWGRVGYSLSRTTYSNHATLAKKKAEKLKKGYTQLKTIDGNQTKAAVIKNGDLGSLASRQLNKTNNPELDKMIKVLVDSNVHNITSSTSIVFDSSSGVFTTPLGIVEQGGIDEGRNLLVKIKNRFTRKRDLIGLTSKYLRIIPHNLGMKLSIDSIFPNIDSIQKESGILDSLEASLLALKSNSKKNDSAIKTVDEQVFNVDFDILPSSDKEFARINKWFENSKKKIHGYDGVKIRNAYKLQLEENIKQFEEKNGNIHEVWHGSSIANVLSIMKSGLRVSPPSTAAIAGKMFGNGVYGSKTSTKSLGYTFGRWGQGNRGSSGFLFVLDFVMGNAYYPARSLNSIPSGYHSCYALPEKTGLHNDELIVYSEKHLKIKYLLEVK